MVVTIHYVNEHDQKDRRSFTFESKNAAMDFLNAQEPIRIRSDEYLPRHRVQRYTVGAYWTENPGL